MWSMGHTVRWNFDFSVVVQETYKNPSVELRLAAWGGAPSQPMALHVYSFICFCICTGFFWILQFPLATTCNQANPNIEIPLACVSVPCSAPPSHQGCPLSRAVVSQFPVTAVGYNLLIRTRTVFISNSPWRIQWPHRRHGFWSFRKAKHLKQTN